MLSPQSAEIVRATAGAVAAHGVEITSAFYDRLFAAHPELLRLFNQGNQANGDQRRALATSVVAFAEHLLGVSETPFAPVLERIAHKHVSLGVRPEQYTIVGENLLAAVGEVLGDAVTPAVRAAWEEVYWLFAVLLAAEEGRLYERAGVDPARPWSRWRVAARVPDAPDVVSFELVPADGGAVPYYRPGQYVSVAVDLPDGGRQPRQYTLSDAPGNGSLRITVRRVTGVDGGPDGMVSTFLHDTVKEGDVLELSSPAGDVTLPPGEDPLLLVSAGIGVTPTVAMLAHLARTQPGRRVVVAHADRSPLAFPLRARVEELGRQLDAFEALFWYERPDDEHRLAGHEQLGLLPPALLPVPPGARVHLCGPIPFMRAVRAGLLERGVPAERVQYEVFGPDLWAGTPG
ncbi:hemin transporter [Frankia sp. CNm7]|uniref:nitric oxide dioxygenase n=1 Tax=Frankia nepalensis TaxID=1836974 RepID=A0A937RD23_9ACTN|nr:globin domain-containing protein [Frankia nepalensis]MBL7499342.1 hemin transporter [Frankia nepalensis]MBL7515210.1 hemin transporter [Frankia nepalensis]MBL7524003.1 hemin transporter [Frankia nepalensis]MBL7629886.1 hemin transporter [Frankia nepalensis]